MRPSAMFAFGAEDKKGLKMFSLGRHLSLDVRPQLAMQRRPATDKHTLTVDCVVTVPVSWL